MNLWIILTFIGWAGFISMAILCKIALNGWSEANRTSQEILDKWKERIARKEP